MTLKNASSKAIEKSRSLPWQPSLASMSTDEELKKEINMNQLMQKVKRSSPRKGRRATSSITDSSLVKDDDTQFGSDDVGPPSFGLQGEGDVAPPKPPRRKTGGWADSLAKSAKGKRSSTGYEEDNVRSEYDNEKDIASIPDLDDFQEEDLATQVAKAPNIAVNRVATYRELDSDLLKHSAFSTLDDIDLKVLTKFLSPECEIQEEDVPWTWDMLLAAVSAKLNIELESPEDA